MSVSRLLAVTATAALFATPALASGPPPGHGNGHRTTEAPATTMAPAAGDDAATPGPDASAKTKAKAYGRACQGESKKHVKGEKGTAFSRCVTALAKAATDDATSPREACHGLRKKHVKGEKGTAFSRCVKAAAKVQEDQQDAEGSNDEDAGDIADAPAAS